MKDNDVKCPQCGKSPMIKKQNRSTGEFFLGCRDYPNCTGTLNMKDAKGKHYTVQIKKVKCIKCNEYYSGTTSDGFCPSCVESIEKQ